MTDQQAEPAGRYAPHISIPAIGAAGQARLRAAKVLIIGLGGLGCPVSQYLASSGVGHLILCDFDRVHETNLSRQILYHPGDVNRFKAKVARERLIKQNPDVSIKAQTHRADEAGLTSLARGCDLIIDASDNYGTRIAINQYCIGAGLPWVMGACIRMEGQVMLFDPAIDDNPCYRCAYGVAPETLEDCPGAGIFSPVAGIIGCLMAQFALTRLAGIDQRSALHLFDGSQVQWQRIKVSKNPGCRGCCPS